MPDDRQRGGYHVDERFEFDYEELDEMGTKAHSINGKPVLSGPVVSDHFDYLYEMDEEEHNRSYRGVILQARIDVIFTCLLTFWLGYSYVHWLH